MFLFRHGMQRKTLLFASFAIIAAAIFFVLLIVGDKNNTFKLTGTGYIFKTEETNFTVIVPSRWTVMEEPRLPAGTDYDASPDEGIRLLLDGNDDNYIWIYAQYGHILPLSDYYEKEGFITKQGVHAHLYEERECPASWQIIYDNTIAPNFYGAVVKFDDGEAFAERHQEILDILSSLEINDP